MVVIVSGVADQSADMPELLKHRPIAIGTNIEVKKKFDFDQSLEIKTGPGTFFSISVQSARNIFVHYEPEK